VGDSRAYLLRQGTLRQITQDHTYIQHLVDTGQLDPSERFGHPWSNIVLRSLDGGPDQAFDVSALDVEVGDRLLLCSDGLTDLVRDDRIAEVLRLADPHSASAVLTQSALLAGGRDNITAVVLDVVEGPRVVGDGRVLGALADVRNIVDPGSVHVVH
jgi:protein phosphatase